jgi:hypothetical protein
MEQPARLATEFVDRTHGLDTIEKEPLNLLGPSYLPDGSGMMLDSSVSVQNLDIIDLLDL